MPKSNACVKTLVVLFSVAATVLYGGAIETRSASPASLTLISSIDIFDSLGIGPDDITYSSQDDTLIISSIDPPNENAGIFEITQDGILVRQLPLPAPGFGYSISYAKRSKGVSSVFMGEYNGTSSIQVLELTYPELQIQNQFTFVGGVMPGDGIAYSAAKPEKLAIVDLGFSPNTVFEMTPDGESLLRVYETPPFAGMTAKPVAGGPLQGWYAVNHMEALLYEVSSLGDITRVFDLKSFGVQQPIGVAAGGGRIFVADERTDNAGGYLYIFKAPPPAQ
jgi:hypothetical protein